MKTGPAFLLLAAGLAIGKLTLAQTYEDTEGEIEHIFVTGARSPVSISRIGSSTTVISRSEIESRQARYVTDLLRSVPGFAVSHSGVIGSQTQVRVRGSEANHVLVLIDGVRANDPATGDEFRWEHLSADNIEHIEIVRGPQSALWGSDAIGAVVNVITRSEPGQQNVGSYLERGSNDSLNLGANGAGSIGNWVLGGGIESLDTDGENISRSGSENDGSSLRTGSLSARYDGLDRLAIDFGLRAYDATSQFDPVDFFVTGLPADGNLETRSDNLVADIGATLATGQERVIWHFNAGYFDSDHRNFVDDIQDSSTGAKRMNISLQSDIQLGENRASFAVEQEDTEFKQRGAVVFGDPNQDQDMQVSSAVAEYQHFAGDQLTWIISARYDESSDFQSAVTGKVSAAYQWTDETRLRASIGTGQKTPTFTERFGYFPAQFVGNPYLKPETSVSYDFGIDRDFWEGAFAFQASVYWQELEDEINGFVFNPVTFISTADNRPGESERSGIELATQWQINSRISLGSSYTYTDSSEEDDVGQTVLELRRPKHAGSISLNVASQDERFRATLAADYGGTRSDLFFPPFPAPQQMVTLDNYWLVDLNFQFRLTDSLSLFARGTNLLDAEYEQVYGYRTLGRAGYFGVRANFGR